VGVVKNLRELGRRHVFYNISPESYELHSVVFVQTVRKAFAHDWNEQLERALQWSMDLIIVCMLEGMVEEEHKRSTSTARQTVVAQVERGWTDMQPLLHKHARKVLSQAEFACSSVRHAYDTALAELKAAHGFSSSQDELLCLQHLVRESHEAVARLGSFIARTARQIASPLVRPGAGHDADLSALVWTSTSKAACEELSTESVQLALISLYRAVMSKFGFTLLDLYTLADTFLDAIHEALLPGLPNADPALLNPASALSDKERSSSSAAWVWLVQRCVNIIATHIASEDEAARLLNTSALLSTALARAYPATQPAPALGYLSIPASLPSLRPPLVRLAQDSVQLLPTLAAMMQAQATLAAEAGEAAAAGSTAAAASSSAPAAQQHVYPRGALVQLLFTHLLTSAFADAEVDVPAPPPPPGEKPLKPLPMSSDSFVPAARSSAGAARRKHALLSLLGRSHVHTQLELLWEAVALQTHSPGKASKPKLQLIAQRLAAYNLDGDLFVMEPTHKAPTNLFRTEAFAGSFPALRAPKRASKEDHGKDKDKPRDAASRLAQRVQEQQDKEKADKDRQERERRAKEQAAAADAQGASGAVSAGTDRDALGIWVLNCMCVSLRQVLGAAWGRRESDALFWLCSHYVFPLLRLGTTKADRQWLFAQQAWSWLCQYIGYHMTAYTRQRHAHGQRLALFLDEYASAPPLGPPLGRFFALQRNMASIHTSRAASALFFSPLRAGPTTRVAGPLRFATARCVDASLEGDYVLARFEIPRACVAVHNTANLGHAQTQVDDAELLAESTFSLDWLRGFLLVPQLSLAMPSTAAPATLETGIVATSAAPALFTAPFLARGGEASAKRAVPAVIVYAHHAPSRRRLTASGQETGRTNTPLHAQLSTLLAFPRDVWDRALYMYHDAASPADPRPLPLAPGCTVGVRHPLLAHAAVPAVHNALATNKTTPPLFLHPLPPLMAPPRSLVAITCGAGCFPLLSLLSALALARAADPAVHADAATVRARHQFPAQARLAATAALRTSLACFHCDHVLPLPFALQIASHLTRGPPQPPNTQLIDVGIHVDDDLEAGLPPPGSVSARFMAMCGPDGALLPAPAPPPDADTHADSVLALAALSADAATPHLPVLPAPALTADQQLLHRELLAAWKHLVGVPDARSIALALPMLAGPSVQPPEQALHAAHFLKHGSVHRVGPLANQAFKSRNIWQHQYVYVGGPTPFLRHVLLALYILCVPRDNILIHATDE
jgi:hypothetical protein